MAETYYHDVVCPACGARTTERPDQVLARLRGAGLLRRAKDPDLSELVELFRAASDRLTCDACGAAGLRLEVPADQDDDEDWGDPQPCEQCGALIPAERLELFPDTKLCVACQQQAEKGGGDTGEVEYCPRCGSIMQLRKTRSGITRYVMECPQCR